MPSGLTTDGYFAKTTQEFLDDINDSQKAAINPGLNLSSATPLGQINGIVAAKLGDLSDMMRAVYSAFYPSSASGRSLDSVCSITGTLRHSATKSQLSAVTVNLNAGFSAAAGEMVAAVDGDPTRRFVSTELAENTGGSAADFSINFEAETAGAVECLAGQLTVIAQPLSGWNSVTNPTDAVVGDEIDTDAQLRIRREQELAGGSTTADGIRTDILQNEDLGVTFCRVLSNDGDTTDVNGLPPHSVEVIARGPDSPTSDDNQALADQIWASKGGGIRAYGTASEIVVDSQENAYSVGYTRPTLKNTYIEIDVVIDTNLYPEDGDDQIKEALADFGDDNYQPGDDVIAERLKAVAFTVAGVTDVSALRLGFSASPSGTANLSIAIREIAALDTSRVLVTQV